jgi:hypothetical protein
LLQPSGCSCDTILFACSSLLMNFVQMGGGAKQKRAGDEVSGAFLIFLEFC